MYMIPLPNSPQGFQDFAAVKRKQKKMIDRILLKQAKKRSHLLSPEVMRDWLEKFSLDNIGESFRRMHDMQCGGTYHGYVCLLHIVSIVKDFDKVQELQRPMVELPILPQFSNWRQHVQSDSIDLLYKLFLSTARDLQH